MENNQITQQDSSQLDSKGMPSSEKARTAKLNSY